MLRNYRLPKPKTGLKKSRGKGQINHKKIKFRADSQFSTATTEAGK